MDLGEHPLGAVGRWVLLCQTTLAHLKRLAVARSGVRLHWSSASGKWVLHSVAPVLSSLHWWMFLERWKVVFSHCIWVPPKCWGKLRQMSTHRVCLCGVLVEFKASFFFFAKGPFFVWWVKKLFGVTWVMYHYCYTAFRSYLLLFSCYLTNRVQLGSPWSCWHVTGTER